LAAREPLRAKLFKPLIRLYKTAQAFNPRGESSKSKLLSSHACPDMHVKDRKQSSGRSKNMRGMVPTLPRT
ncbi:MAG TPA: hypothetical protein DDW94_05230, partial [Deltaproteobacteria bacterium]|nr:hypothetical protein [Deltaproteobacteria bacterium]